jgi:hypothetical protein
MSSRFLDTVSAMCMVWRPMRRRGIGIRVTFAPTRLASEHLRGAYEQVLPIVEREVARDVPDASGVEREQIVARSERRRAQ